MVLVLLFLVACSGTSTPAPSASAEQPAAAEAPTAPAKPVVIQVWNPEDDPSAIGLMTAASKDFEAKNPGVTVELTTIPWGDIYPKWMTAIEAGTTPDVSFASAAYARSLYSIGALLPVTDSIPQDFFADSAKSLVDVHTAEDGEIVGVPFVQNCVVLWYRKSALAEKGLGVPKTWEELRNTAAALTENNKYGMLLTASRSHITQQMFYSMILANGGEITDHATGSQNLFGSPENLETLKFYTELAQYTPPGSLGYERPDAESAMATGQIDMFIYGSWLAGALLNTAPEVFNAFAVAPVPTNNGNRGSNMGNMDMIAFKNSQNPELAKAFMLNMLDNKNYVPFVTSNPASYIPVTKACQESPEYNNNEMVIAIKDMIDVVKQELPYAWVYGAPNPKAGELEGLSTITHAITRVLLEGMTPEDALATTAQEVGDVLQIQG